MSTILEGPDGEEPRFPTDDTMEIPRVGRNATLLRADCLRLLAHDMNNPLTAIRILSEMLRDQVGSAEMRQDVIDILESADMASALMDGISSLVMLEARDEEYTWFPMDLVQVIRQALDRPALRRYIRVDLPREIQMTGDRTAWLRAFTDIFVNARKLVDGPREISVTARDEGADHVVRVHHPGDGVPRGMRDRLFEMFGAVEIRHNRVPVSASGLAFPRAVVEVHGGAIGFEDPAPSVVGLGGRGMDLVIRLPR